MLCLILLPARWHVGTKFSKIILAHIFVSLFTLISTCIKGKSALKRSTYIDQVLIKDCKSRKERNSRKTRVAEPRLFHMGKLAGVIVTEGLVDKVRRADVYNAQVFLSSFFVSGQRTWVFGINLGSKCRETWNWSHYLKMP